MASLVQQKAKQRHRDDDDNATQTPIGDGPGWNLKIKIKLILNASEIQNRFHQPQAHRREAAALINYLKNKYRNQPSATITAVRSTIASAATSSLALTRAAARSALAATTTSGETRASGQ